MEKAQLSDNALTNECRFNGNEVPQDYSQAHPDVARQTTAAEISSRLAAIVQSSDDAIVAKDLHGIITSWNTSAEIIFGYSEHEVLAKPIALIIPPELQPEELEILRRLRAGERIDHFETARVAKGGKRILVSLPISPVEDSSSRIECPSKLPRLITR